MRSFMSVFAFYAIKASGYKRRAAIPEKREKYYRKLERINRSPVKAPKLIFPAPEEKLIGGVQVFFFNKGKSRKVVYLHGGGYCEQPVLPHWQLCAQIAKKTASTVIMPVYKKAPNNSFEGTFDFLEDFWRELTAESGSRNVFIMGDSSGGGLALAFCEQLKLLGLPQPKRMILISPWVDVTMTTKIPEELDRKDPSLQNEHLRRMAEMWAGGADLRDPRLSPINGDLSGLAPMTVFYGTHETIILDGRRLKAECEKQGAELDFREAEGMNHCFVLYPTPEGARARKEIIELIKGKKEDKQ